MSFDYNNPRYFAVTPKTDYAAEALKYTYVKNVCERLQNEHIALLEKLTEKEDISVSVFLNNGNEVLVSQFDYSGTNLLIVKGTLNGRDVTIFLHQSSLQVVFAKIPKEISEPRRAIGFVRQETSPVSQGEKVQIKE